MSTIINATTTNGVVIQPDNSGSLVLQSSGTTKATVDSGGFKINGDYAVAYQGMKNRIINGDMRIDQRNAGASVTSPSSSFYVVDRWNLFASQASKFTVQQNQGSVTPPTGFNNYLGITSSSAYTVGSSELFVVGQPIEGYNVADFNIGTANAKTVTLSFWIRSSLTGTFGASLLNGGQNRSYAFTYTISAANTWEQKTVTITLDTTGTWLTTNGTGLFVYWSLACGSSYLGSANSWGGAAYFGATGQTNILATNGATFYITGVQLEIGSTATPFERRMYGQELALCQRYWWTNPNTYRYVKMRESDRLRGCTISLPVPMRATPTMTKISDPSGITWTWQLASVTSVYGDGTAPSDGYTDYSGVMQASAEL